MSTRCRIGIENKDGSVTSIYCHHDGYIAHVGKVLVENYKTIKSIKDLMKLGNLSSLGTKPVENPKAWEMPSIEVMFSSPGSYTNWYMETHPKDMCECYITRGEDSPCTTVPDVKSYVRVFNKSDQNYCYLFTADKEWKYITRKQGVSKFRSVKEAVNKIKED